MAVRHGGHAGGFVHGHARHLHRCRVRIRIQLRAGIHRQRHLREQQGHDKAADDPAAPFLNHDNSDTQTSDHMHDDVFVRSVYFFDPDGVCLEFAAWTKEFTDADVAHDPVTADGIKKEGMIVQKALAQNDVAELAPAK